MEAKGRVVIIGSGPSGMSCALWLCKLGYQPVILEKSERPCGMLCLNHHPNDWLLGAEGQTGHSLADRFYQHLLSYQVKIYFNTKIQYITRKDSCFLIDCCDVGQSLEAQYLVIASGTRPKATGNLKYFNEKFPEKILIGAGQLVIDKLASSLDVLVLGGGDNAFENAWWLSEKSNEVNIVYRSGVPRAHQQWIEKCEASDNIFTFSSSAIEITEVDNNKVYYLLNGKERLCCDIVVVMYGYEPNTAFLQQSDFGSKIQMNNERHIVVDRYQRTTVNRVYAIGDVTENPFPSVPTAIAQGCVAAKTILMD